MIKTQANTPHQAFGIGIRRSKEETTLDVLYPEINTPLTGELYKALQTLIQSNATGFYPLDPQVILDSSHSALKKLHPWAKSVLDRAQKDHYSHIDMGVFILDTDADISTVEAAFFKLQLMSQRKAKPHSLNLNGLFKTLHNLAWTNKGPMKLEDVDTERLKALFTDTPLQITHVDKFPYLIHYHIPSGVRIASGSQVRLGAYLGEGTTIMPAGYVNFNAGTEGNTMVEGRISAGVVVGKNTDIGGGASIMGTLSGGNEHVIAIGEYCLLGANSGTGISLGKGCTIAAGLYVYAGMKIALYNDKKQPIALDNTVVKEGENEVNARDLSGREYLLFIQDSRSGKVLCRPNTKLIKLNESLHQHN